VRPYKKGRRDIGRQNRERTPHHQTLVRHHPQCRHHANFARNAVGKTIRKTVVWKAMMTTVMRVMKALQSTRPSVASLHWCKGLMTPGRMEFKNDWKDQSTPNRPPITLSSPFFLLIIVERHYLALSHVGLMAKKERGKEGIKKRERPHPRTLVHQCLKRPRHTAPPTVRQSKVHTDRSRSPFRIDSKASLVFCR
jgi:hypothetical protein